MARIPLAGYRPDKGAAAVHAIQSRYQQASCGARLLQVNERLQYTGTDGQAPCSTPTRYLLWMDRYLGNGKLRL